MKHSIIYSSELVKTFETMNLTKGLTSCVRNNIYRFVRPCFFAGYRGKMVDFARYNDHHRTSLAHFLNKGKWNDALLLNTLKQNVIEKVYQQSRETGLPVLCIIDDTISSKTRPSSQAENPMESASNHMSHLKGQMDYGHQAIGVMLACGEMILNYAILLYDKSKSKIDMVCQIASELPEPPTIGYFLCDSWYTCEKVMDAFIVKGFHTIAGLKTNRVIYSNGIRQQISDFARHLRRTDTTVHKVTIGKRNYRIYRYNGKLNGADSASAILSYPEKAFGKPDALRAFICTNEALSEREILNLYTQRWSIENFFRETKGKLALDKYQIRSATGVRRFWLMMSLVHFVCCVGKGTFCAFADGFRYWQRTLAMELTSFIYACGKSRKPMPSLG